MNVNRFNYRLLAALLLLLIFNSAWGGTAAKQRLQDFLDHNRSLQAEFNQTIMSDKGQQAYSASGVLYIQRPGQFRWEYQQPYKQKIIASGKQVWVYDEDLEQITTSPQGMAIKGTPALLLSSDDPVDKHFEVFNIGADQGLEWAELIPRDEDSQFMRIVVGFNGKELERLEMEDKFGQVTTFQFSQISHNPKLEKKLFSFENPGRYEMFHH
jgi:outer membrane lipoprotein carrier protein